MKKKYNKRYITDGKRNQKEALIEKGENYEQSQ